MQNNLTEHEWVTDFSEFEAVLVCKNDLASFDAEVCLRAYQTFKWDEASTPGNDLAFRHEATGALVRHDGAVVAIDTLHNDPGEPLQDLFRVLNGLGWNKAEVYHPAETMALMLRDMGKAIPANLKFDIEPAAAVINISNFAESKALVSRGQEILKNNRGVISSSMMVELESITSEIMDGDGVQGVATTASSPAPSGGAFQDFELDDDEPQEVGGFVGSVAEVRQAPSPAEAADDGYGVFSSSEPSFGGALESQMPPAPVSFENENGGDDLTKMVLENERLREELAASQDARWQLAKASAMAEAKATALDGELRNSISNLELELSAAVDREERAGEVALRDGTIRENLMNEVIELRDRINQVDERVIMESDVVKIGASALCFDFPENPMDGAAVESLATDYGFSEIVHLHVGSFGQLVRWDVLGEISAQCPWEAENLVSGFNFPDEHCALVASIFLDLKEKMPKAQLRDLLRDSVDGRDEKSLLREVLSGGVPPSMGLLFGRQHPLENLDALVLPLSPLALCPEGWAFVDIRPEVGGFDDLEIFTVRGLLDSFAAKLFVVHVDSMDGPFVKTVADLLRVVALRYGASKRYEAVELREAGVPLETIVEGPADADSEGEGVWLGVQEGDSAANESEKNLDALNVLLGGFVQELQSLGIGTAAKVGG